LAHNVTKRIASLMKHGIQIFAGRTVRLANVTTAGRLLIKQLYRLKF